MTSGLSQWLFNPSGLTPHGFCLLWEPGLIWLYAISDVAIGIAYFAIPFALAVFVRRRPDLVFRPVIWLFAAFIILCGITHWLDVLTIWVPAYGVEAVFKAATGIVSLITAYTLWRLMPKALALPSPAQLRDANDALRISEARARTRFESSPVPLYTIDDANVITGVSDTWVALMGYTRDQAVGRPITEFWSRADAAVAVADRATLTTVGEVHDREREFRRADGSVIQALVSGRYDRGATPPITNVALTDVTARLRTEAALREAEERLRQSQKMQAIGQLTGGIAHDVNNQLQGISGSLELMERRIAQGRADDAARCIKPARHAVDGAASLIHRLLAFSRRQTLQLGPIAAETLVRGMEDLIRRTVGPEIQLDLRLSDGKWHALSDANQLESALLNLAINARDAMPDGGTLTVASADHHLTEAELAGEDGATPGDYVVIEVTDTGCGMTAEVQARAFEPFFTTKPSGSGTGLGLSQIYGFVRQSGGFVQVDSTPGQGTTVRLYLPRSTETPIEHPVRPAVPPDAFAALNGRVVLLVEDEPDIRAQASEALRDLGCQVIEANDGPGGLRILRSAVHIDLLVSDIGMPGLNGRQLADTARETRPGLRVILITGYAGTALDLRLAPGMTVLHKPFSLAALTEEARAVFAPATEPAAPVTFP